MLGAVTNINLYILIQFIEYIQNSHGFIEFFSIFKSFSEIIESLSIPNAYDTLFLESVENFKKIQNEVYSCFLYAKKFKYQANSIMSIGTNSLKILSWTHNI